MRWEGFTKIYILFLKKCVCFKASEMHIKKPMKIISQRLGLALIPEVAHETKMFTTRALHTEAETIQKQM